MSTKKIETDSKGIPLKGPYPDNPPVAVLYLVMTTVQTFITTAIAYYVIAKDNTTKTDAKLALLIEHDLGYLYVTSIIYKLGFLLMGINAGQTRKESKIHTPDQHVYQVQGAEGSKLGYVLLQNDDQAFGRFNRAQRAIANYLETFPQVVLYTLLAGFMYPKEVMILAILLILSRLVSAIGYTKSADRRITGFMLANLTVGVLEGLVIIISARCFMN